MKEAKKMSKFATQVSVGVDSQPKFNIATIFPRNKHPQGGWVLSKDDAINAGWKNMPTTWEEHVCDSGTMEVMIFKSIRCCVLRSTPAYIESRGTGEFAGIVNWETYVHDKEIAKVCQNYLLLLLDEKNQPLHDRPIHYKAHGNAGLSFTQAFVGNNNSRGFYRDLELAIGDRLRQEGVVFEDKDLYKTHFNSKESVAEPWHNCSAIRLKFKAEKRGAEDDPKKQSFCCIVESYEIPKADNCEDFWLEELKPKIAEMIGISSNWSRKIIAPRKTFQLQVLQNSEIDGFIDEFDEGNFKLPFQGTGDFE